MRPIRIDGGLQLIESPELVNGHGGGAAFFDQVELEDFLAVGIGLAGFGEEDTGDLGIGRGFPGGAGVGL